MKASLVAIIVLLLVQISETQVPYRVIENKVIYGSSDNWEEYNGSGNGIVIHVDLSDYQLVETPFVTTFLTCAYHCWNTAGATSIYNLSNTGFSVYLYGVDQILNVPGAQNAQFGLNYKV